MLKIKNLKIKQLWVRSFKWFLNFKMSVKLISAFVIIALILAGVGYFSFINMGKLSDSLDQMYNERLKPIQHVSNALNAFQIMKGSILQLHFLPTVNEKTSIASLMRSQKDKIDRELNSYVNLANMSGEQELEHQEFLKNWQRFNDYYDELSSLSINNKEMEFRELYEGAFSQIAIAIDEYLTNLVEQNISMAERANKEANDLSQSASIAMTFIIIVALAISILFGYVISRIVSKPLTEVVNLVGKVAKGDLRETTNIDTRDEIGQLATSINNMIHELRSIVSNILSSAESLSAASQQITASTEEIANGSTLQAQSAQTMSELFQELSKAINSVARSAEEASELASKTVAIAEEGGKVVKSSIEGMNVVSTQMSKLEQDSAKIGEIIGVIDAIADQTNLLALNAAIEAARAGDQGRGFAVVADEVRKLAERSGEATKQITAIIKEMQQNTQQSVAAVLQGVASSQQTGHAFENIIAMVNNSAQKVVEIAAASEQQAAQSSEVMAAIESISASTEEAASSSEETAASAQSLNQLANELTKAVAAFKIS